MGFTVEDEEVEMLDGLEPKYFKLYFMIKKHMDFASGVTGIKRKISHQSLKEAMWIEPRKGVKIIQYSIDSIRRMEKELEKIGLFQRLSTEDQLIFKHLFARMDNCVQNKAAMKPPGYADRVRVKNKNIESDGYRNLTEQAATPKTEKAAIPPLSSSNLFNTNVLNNNNVELDENLHTTDLFEEPEQKPQPELNVQPTTQQKQKTHPDKEIITRIFEHWKTTMNHPRAKLDKARKQVIRKALDKKQMGFDKDEAGFTEDELKQAITGCSKSPYHMGRNNNQTVYDRLGLIFRDAEQIERFITEADKPDLPPTPKGGRDYGKYNNQPETNYERVMREGNEFLARGEPLY